MRGPSHLLSLFALTLQHTRAPATVAAGDHARADMHRAPPHLVVPDSGWVTTGDGANVRITGLRRGDRVAVIASHCARDARSLCRDKLTPHRSPIPSWWSRGRNSQAPHRARSKSIAQRQCAAVGTRVTRSEYSGPCVASRRSARQSCRETGPSWNSHSCPAAQKLRAVNSASDRMRVC